MRTLVRSPEKRGEFKERVEFVQGSVFEPADIEEAVRGAEAVPSMVGPPRRNPTDPEKYEKATKDLPRTDRPCAPILAVGLNSTLMGVIYSLVAAFAGLSLPATGGPYEDPAHPVHLPVAPPHRPRVSDKQLLAGRPVVVSFEALGALLEPGYEVVVYDEAGRKTRGRISSISRDRAVIDRERASPLLRLFSSPRSHECRADSVTRIDIVDSPWNGVLVGAAIAPALVFAVHKWEETTVPDSNSLKGLWTTVFGSLGAMTAIGVGYWIDLSINKPIYVSERRTARVSLAPWLEPSRMGVVLRVGF